MKTLFKILVLLLVLVAVAGATFLFFMKFESQPPVLELKELSPLAGRKLSFKVQVRDARAGVRKVRVVLAQKDRDQVLLEKEFPTTFLQGSRIKEKTWSLEVDPVQYGFREGEAKVIVEAWDASWREKLKGNFAQKVVSLQLDLTPPAITLLSGLTYIARGGSALVVYQIKEEVASQGVWLNNRFFKGRPLGEGVFAALVALSVQEKSIRKFAIRAEDKAGNALEIPVSYYLKRRSYPSYKMRISEGFLSRKMPEFLSRYPEAQKKNLLQTFLWVNETLRAQNNQEIARLTSEVSDLPFQVRGALRALPRSAKRSDFGEFRTYYYKGRKISQAWHLGLDLASVARSPVPAAAAGKVVFADYLGIYGYTVILDHGLGLYTLYAHLAGVEVSPGAEVEAGQIIGHTDTTGLAGGDHLHFSVLVQGVFVNPVEWLDPQWVKNRILAPLEPYL